MDKPVNLLWTGGWDSTFRLLQLLIIEKSYVQPIYVIDSSRKSLSLELKTMDKIVSLINIEFPEASQYLLDTIFFNKSESLEFKQIHNYFEEFQKAGRIGHQYLWMAIIAEKYKLFDLEIGQENVQQSDTEGTWLHGVLPLLRGKGHACRVDYSASPYEKFQLFKYYRYPLFEYSKSDMATIAKESNFYSILQYAWFCHFPIHNRPCGRCRPCQIAMKSGQLTIHKINSPMVTQCYSFLKKVERRFISATPFDEI